MRISYAIAAGAAVVLVACGGSSDEEEIRAVFAAYQEAAEDVDGQRLCEDILAPSQLGDESVERCARRQDRRLKKISQPLPEVKLRNIAIEGDVARANGTKGFFFSFQREDGRWGLILIR